MQPVQYQGYSAQGTAFNPLVLSDQSRKILEQNEAFLQSLQAKQKIERDIEVAKLKQLQQNVENQRQQLNENFNYESRQRDSYNQSLQESAARQVQDLKRVAALQPEKKTTAAVVNEVADFLVSASKTAADVVGAIKKEKDARDTAAATELLNSGGKITNAYIGMQVGGRIVLDTANNNVIATYATAKAFQESGFELQAGQKLIEVDQYVQAKLGLLDTEQKINGFNQKFSIQEEYKLDGKTISRADFNRLDPATQEKVYNQGIQELVGTFRKKASPHIQTRIDAAIGTKKSEYIGKKYKEYAKILDGQVLEAARVEALMNPTAENIHIFTDLSMLKHGGDYKKALSDTDELLNDPAISDAQYEAYYDSSSQTAPGVPLRESNPQRYSEGLKERKTNELSAVRQQEQNLEIEQAKNIAMFIEATDQDRRDNNRLDDVRKAELAQLADEYEAKGQYKFARLLRANIAITSDQITIDQNKKEMDALYAQGRLTLERVRDSGVMGQEFVDYMKKAEENRAITAPIKQNLDVATGYITRELKGRLTGGYGFKGELPGSYEIAKAGALRQYEAVYRNEMRRSGDHALAHDAGMGAFKADMGNDPTKGLYRIGNSLEEITNQLKNGERAGDFLDESLKIKPVEAGPNAITELRERVKDLGMGAIPTTLGPERLAKTVDQLRSTGRIDRDPTAEALSKILGIPYYEVHNYAAEKHKQESLKIPDTITQGAAEFEAIAYSGPIRKFLNNPANIPPEFITGRVMQQASGVTYDNLETQSPTAVKQQLTYEGITNPVGQALVDMAQRNGWDPSDIAAIVGRETGDFDINKPGVGAAEGRRGWFQGGEYERRTYGFGSGDPYEELLAFERYCLDRGCKPGSSLADLYSAVNNGRAWLGYEPDGNGVIPRSPENMRVLESYRVPGIKFFGLK